MKGALATAFTTWLALIALQALSSTPGAPRRVADAFRDVDALLERALDPTVPAIPDRRGTTGPAGPGPVTKIPGRVVPKPAPAPTPTPRLPVPGAPLPV